MHFSTPLIAALLTSAAAAPGYANTGSEAAGSDHDAKADQPDTGSASKTTTLAAGKTFSTGVAKGRDLLDSAISASTLDEADLPKLGTPTVVGIIANLQASAPKPQAVMASRP
jgi:hypothetical protein